MNCTNIISAIMAWVMSLTMLSGCKSEKPDEPHPSQNGITTIDNGKMREDMTANDFAKELGIGINLGNTMEAYYQNLDRATTGCSVIGNDTPLDYERCWGAIETTQEMINGMAAEGFSTVRIPVYWGNMMADDGTFTINPTYFNRVEELINYCRNNGLYVVINIHHYDEYIIKHYAREDAVNIARSLWTQIAQRYAEYSDYLIFEGYNENLGSSCEGANLSEDELFSYVNEMNRTFVDAVRATGGNNAQRLLIVSGYWTNIDKTTDARFIMPADTAENRLMVSVHYIDNAMYWTNRIGGQEWLDYSRAQCELLKNAFTDKGIPVFVGECTSIYDESRFAGNATVTESTQALKTIMDMCGEYGFVPVLWDVCNNFYSRWLCRISNDSDRALIHEIAGVPEQPETQSAASAA